MHIELDCMLCIGLIGMRQSPLALLLLLFVPFATLFSLLFSSKLVSIVITKMIISLGPIGIPTLSKKHNGERGYADCNWAVSIFGWI